MGMLDGSIALVTGGGRGIGRAVALALADAGASVVIAGRDIQALEQTQAMVQEHGAVGLVQTCDVTDSAAVQEMFAWVRATLGTVDILVNNAGITASIKFTELDDQTWDQIMRVNVTGAFYCCRAAVPGMIERGAGRIINIASIAALSGIPYSSAYSASKHALLGLTRSLALELARHRITANAVCPGWVETDMMQRAVANIVEKTGRTTEQARTSILELSGQKAVITPETVAAAVLRLAGPDGANTTGQAITVE